MSGTASAQLAGHLLVAATWIEPVRMLCERHHDLLACHLIRVTREGLGQRVIAEAAPQVRDDFSE